MNKAYNAKKDYKNISGYSLIFKYGVSRATDNYGENTVGCWFNGNEKRGFCVGGNYDMNGTAFAEFIENTFREELKAKSAKGYYGFHFYNKKTRKRQTQWSENCSNGGFLDGGCGFDSILQVFRDKLGYNLRYVSETANQKIYIIEIV